MDDTDLAALQALKTLVKTVERCDLEGTKASDSFAFSTAKDLVETLRNLRQKKSAALSFP